LHSFLVLITTTTAATTLSGGMLAWLSAQDADLHMA